MRKERLAHFRKKLEEKHRQLVDEVGKNVQYGKGPEDDSIKDLGDQASSAYNREFLFGLGNGERRQLKDVASALQKLDDGSFGACERCGETIELVRLSCLAYEIGQYTLGLRPADGIPIVESGKYVRIHEQQADGSWLWAVEMFNPEAASAHGRATTTQGGIR